ncbi:ABC transporter permease [Thermoflexus sp.]|uniref:ABC transporter permease n=1 Tax=Thermoflexus sp. TaxID=1969742 RepID=UPI0025E96A01|nr:ABC transporter permease [Thermoflexus sp.]MDW8179978.1 ABC transporter permease [Anaerolineae bacterium]MCS6962551.1 ABC transporter permease [Thermoflexus sp.]MCS7350527.1 ABC transporter permease [Thermoflexus sp.]MCX7690754.1 ABC transporter permease [Thermoflexus sp.]MDW8184675.1 ABC transporter permease [Anaerolineae bacterium]
MSAIAPPLMRELVAPRRSPTLEALRRLTRHRSAQVGFFLLGLMVFAAIFADVIAPYDPIKPLKNVQRRAPPCIHLLGCPRDQPQHLFGIDGNNRDLFSRVIYGSRLSLQIGFSTITFAIIVGGLLGAISGYAGGWLDNAIMRVMDVILAFPSLLLAIAIVSVLGPGLINALLAIGFVSIPVYARIVRAAVLAVKELDYVMAAQAVGASPLRMLFVHILPNALTPLIVQGTLGIATAILDAAALSFLGLGAEVPKPEWGLMLGEERNSVFNAPHLVFFPGLAIMLTVLAFNLLGDGLRDALDPRLSYRGYEKRV